MGKEKKKIRKHKLKKRSKRKPTIKLMFPKEAFEPSLRDLAIDMMYGECAELAEKRQRKLRDYIK